MAGSPVFLINVDHSGSLGTFAWDATGAIATIWGTNTNLAAGIVTFPSIPTGSGSAAYIDTVNGNRFVMATSSRRWKTDIHELTPSEARYILSQLRAVRYHSTCAGDDPDEVHFGLIAEDVAAICPALVNFDSEGKPQSVRYEKLPVLQLAARLEH
jgi:hypothetical protein